MKSCKIDKVSMVLGTLSWMMFLATVTAEGEYGANCTVNANCTMSLGLACNKGECDCARPKEMIYDKRITSCIVLESFSCAKTPELNSTEFSCTKHATCVTKSIPGQNITETKTCECEQGYSVNHLNTCRGDFGTNCTEDKEPCNDFALLVCDMIPGEPVGKCGCYSAKDNVYENKKCVALAGARCTTNTPPYILNCIQHATCKLKESETTKNTTGVCECDKGFKVSHGRCKSGVTSIFSSSILVLGAMLLISTQSVQS